MKNNLGIFHSKTEKHVLGPVHTYPDIFENAFFLSDLGLRPHGDGVFGHQKRSFSKRSPEWIFLKTPFSCCRVDG